MYVIGLTCLPPVPFHYQVGEVVGSAGTEGASRQTNKQMYNGKVGHIQARSLLPVSQSSPAAAASRPLMS